MADRTAQARTAVAALSSKDDDALFLELGKRVAMNRKDPRTVTDFDPTVEPEFEALGVMSDLVTLGRDFFGRVNKQAYELMCGADAEDSQERKKLTEAFGLGKDAIGAALAALLVAYLGLAPALAAVVAALALRLFFKPGYEAMCDLWKSKLPSNPAPAAS